MNDPQEYKRIVESMMPPAATGVKVPGGTTLGQDGKIKREEEEEGMEIFPVSCRRGPHATLPPLYRIYCRVCFVLSMNTLSPLAGNHTSTYNWFMTIWNGWQEPGFVIKTKGANGGKVFINIVQSDVINKPSTRKQLDEKGDYPM